MSRSVLSIVLFLASALAAAADLVHVRNSAGEIGFGYLIRYQGACHLLTPHHVIAGPHGSSFGRVLGAPSVRGRARRDTGVEAEVISQSSEYDIALARIEDPSVDCSRSWGFPESSSFNGLLRDAVRTTRKAWLVTQHEARDRRFKIAILDPRPFHFIFEFDDPNTPEKIEGMSGSGLWIDEELVGILIGQPEGEPEGSNRYYALRTEIIAQLLFMDSSPVPKDGTEGVSGAETEPVAPTIREASIAPEALVVAGSIPVPPVLTVCDLMAANPADSMRHPESPGVDFDDLQIEKAVEACTADKGKHPESSRLQYQYARALTARFDQDAAAGNLAEPIAALSNALDMGHGHAMANLRRLLFDYPEHCAEGIPCHQLFVRALEKARALDPNLFTSHLADALAYNDFNNGYCDSKIGCDQTAANLYLALEGTVFWPDARQQLAYLSRRERIELSCDAEGSCLEFQRSVFEEAAEDEIAWAQRELGRLYWEERETETVCTAPEACLNLALDWLDKAVENGDRWAADQLGDMYTTWSAGELLGCAGQEITCAMQADEHYARSVELGHGAGLLGRAWLNLYNWGEMGCDDPKACVTRAFSYLTDPKAPNTNWAKSLRAYGARHYSDQFAPICHDRDCWQTAFDLNREAGKSRTYNVNEAAEMLVATAIFHERKLDCGAPEACLAEAVAFADESYQRGSDRALQPWAWAMSEILQRSPDFGYAFEVSTFDPETGRHELDPDATDKERRPGRTFGCDQAAADCAAAFEAFLSAAETIVSREGSVPGSSFLDVLVRLAFNTEAQGKLGIDRHRTWNVLDDAVELAFAQGKTGILTDVLSLNDGQCDATDCTAYTKNTMLRLAKVGEPDAIKKIVEAALATDCAEGGRADCGPMDDTILIALFQGIEKTRDLRWNIHFNPRANNDLAVAVRAHLEQAGLFAYSARAARLSIWDEENSFALSYAPSTEALQLLRPILLYLTEDPAPINPNRFLGDIVALLQFTENVQVQPERAADAMLLEIVAEQDFEDSLTIRWLREGHISGDNLGAMQRIVGTGVDGSFGPRTLKALERYAQRCKADSACRHNNPAAVARDILDAI